ncbi:cupin domain-containing protein [Actinomadura roseirufa]|uniref:cupin domain-containing protein n=1 Tax=Actinomadura roseirufa TaxID=2094049 RepID=UPI0010415966|nr:cupin domain-containing protein [Actinomadura roseirufa]
MNPARVVRAADGETFGDAPWLFKATGARTAGHFDFMVGEVAHFSGPPLHTHHAQYDSFYVLEGVLTVQVEDEIIELGPGDFVSVPPRVPHTFDNVDADQGPVRVVNLMTPGGLNEVFALAADPALTPEERAARASEYGTREGDPLRVRLGLAAS